MSSRDTVTESAAKAWKDFRATLADRVFCHADDDHILLEVDVLEHHQTPTGPYVQVGWTGDHIFAEVSSNRVLDPKFRIRKEERRLLRALGWRRPDDEHTNYWMTVDPAYADQTADILVTVLRDVFGVVHPAFLVDRFREDLTSTGLDSSEVEHTDELGIAEFPDDPAHLNAMVDVALGSDWGKPSPVRDDDGDIPYRCGSAMVFVRVLHDMPVIRLFSELVVAVANPSAAAFEVAVLNRDNPAVKFVLRGDVVLMSVDLPAHPFVPDHLRAALSGMCDLAPTLDADLAHRVDGRRFFDSADETA